jgi:hypothetical protein
MKNISISELSKFNIQDEENEYLKNRYLSEAISAKDELETLLLELRKKNNIREKENIGTAIMLAHQTIKLVQLSLFDIGHKNNSDSASQKEECN